MSSILNTINARISVRTFSPEPVESATLDALLAFASQLGPGPFGNRVRFGLVDGTRFDAAQLRSLGTYGMINGARLFLCGAVVPASGAAEDFGWAMEQVVLKATELGLGTCWLGGTFDRQSFGRHHGLGAEEVLPATTPIGYPPDRHGVRQRLIRGLVGATRRKDFGKLFFDGSPATPLDEAAAGPWLDCLKAVRQGPSASNKQPWRLVRSPDSQAWHFFMSADPLYARMSHALPIQRVDLGIAMQHFEAVARERGLAGGFRLEVPPPQAGGWTYIASWRS
jgi:nitroreductase